MEPFIVSARKYRPSRFDTVIGQESITSTLKNAIRNHHLAQAFLFCGPRGVGKTTCARILAKTINCENLTEEGEACNACVSCQSFNEGKSLNVFELDAASNNHVEDIRSLIDQVRFSPQAGQYKVYIIDEVHMLSQQAFNAFLKTLEEPPAHAKFILATTEKQKVLPTILSRCQIFDFRRVGIEDIAKHLAFVAKHEGVEAEMEALHVIAQKADGALRDALSTFDQLVSYSGHQLTYKDVVENLNILDHDVFFQMTDHLLEHNTTGAFLLFDEVITRGFDGHHFINGLNGHIRNLLVSKDPQTIPLIEASQNIKDRYLEQSRRCSHPFLLRALDLGNTCDLQYRGSKNPRFLVELTLMKMAGGSAEQEPAAAPAPKKETSSSKPPATNPIQQEKKAEKKEPAPSQKPEQKSPAAAAQPAREEIATPPSPSEPTPPSHQSKTISISGILQKKGEPGNDTSPVETTPEEKHPFTQEELMVHWRAFALQSKEEGRANLHATLMKREPEIGDDFRLMLLIDNKAQEEELESQKAHLLGHLRKQLRNSAIQLETEINREEQDQTPYTAKDKFDKMAEKNPNIQKLRQQLDLDIDY
ncbi:MAG: DNA polymerase III subunit gamma/tau [Flavobacteriales bacterium]|nr:DNA polymerase III subunit gamma/tau [Flavobacteriales bacterium]MCB9448839.1 DNA polymerase III subunit gamma/tau [Flavobacteriales bacterium]